MTQTIEKGLLQNLSSELASIVERVAPSVVRIEDGSRLTATGIIWSADGVIVTTSHGVERDEELSIERDDGSALPATLVGRDPDTDIAVLKVNAAGLPVIQSAPSEDVRVGHIVLAMARPGTAGLQATFGIISARMDSQHQGQEEFILHTDALLYAGFSGGPLVDMRGRVAGITNLMFGRGKGVAVGIPVVTHTVEALLAHGQVRRGYLGVRTQPVPLPASLQSALNTKQDRALLIVQVEPDSPAEQAGLILGDTLLALNGQQVNDAEALRQTLRTLRAGNTVTLRLARGGALKELSVTLGTEG